MKPFADHFSQIAASYAAYRPHYPDALLAWLASVAPVRERVWDCGTGSGQAAVALAGQFAEATRSGASATIGAVPHDVRLAPAVFHAEAEAGKLAIPHLVPLLARFGRINNALGELGG